MKTLEVAVVGSGQAGLYTAEALIKQSAALDPPQSIRVDVLDRLPTPYGLVRYGVAPDHKSIKSIADYLRGVLEHDGVRFLGAIHLGDDVTREDLLASYDAVVYATGAMRDRRLRIPGEDLPGSFAATDFVNWYCGHPDVDPAAFSLDAESVAVIGVGNVAVDVARILVRNPRELYGTDVSQPVLDALMASKVREVHMIGRRGPAQAKFTTKELRELGELAGVDIVVGDGEADLDAFDPTGESARLAQSDRHVRGNYKVISDWAARTPAAGTREADRPVLAAAGRDSRATAGDPVSPWSAPGSMPAAHSPEPASTRPWLRSWCCAAWAIRACRCRESRSTSARPPCRTPMAASSAPDGGPLPGEYVAGWLKRGPTGVIGTNKSDAAQTVRSLLADLAGGPGPGDVPLPRAGLLRYPEAVPGSGPEAADRSRFSRLLAARGIRPVSYADWLRIEAGRERTWARASAAAAGSSWPAAMS